MDNNFVKANSNVEYQSLGTLCDEPNGLTCSYYVAEKWGKAAKIFPFDSFEAAAESVKNGKISAFLVPGAYPQIRSFIMDSDLAASCTFIMQIPALVLCGKTKDIPAAVEILYHHPATTPLLEEVQICFQKSEFVSSNSKACVTLLHQNELSSIAITNELCLNHYGLYLYQTLRTGIQMPWVCFVHA
jgi:prephenate dehydratase